jgi:D-3-phosphoglycerate dehydrogenase / 2-oxoglutarate reductase
MEYSGAIKSAMMDPALRRTIRVRSLADATVLVTPRSFGVDDPAIRTELEASVGAVRYSRLGRPLRADELTAELGDVDGLIAGLDEIDRTVLAAAPRLRVIARYGVGVSNVDLQAAVEHGVVVTNTPGVNADAVAELAIGLIFALARSIPAAAEATRTGAWPTLRGTEISGKTVGILGLGHIGKGVAHRAVGLGCAVVAYDPYVDAHTGSELGIRLASQAEALATADFLTLHLPAVAGSYGMVNRDFLARMRKGSYFVNTARGELVVEDDLLQALESGHLRGAALDTLQQEPPDSNHPLLHRPDVIVTPHIGARTAESTVAMGRTAVRELLAVLSGGTPRFAVPPSRGTV